VPATSSALGLPRQIIGQVRPTASSPEESCLVKSVRKPPDRPRPQRRRSKRPPVGQAESGPSARRHHEMTISVPLGCKKMSILFYRSLVGGAATHQETRIALREHGRDARTKIAPPSAPCRAEMPKRSKLAVTAFPAFERHREEDAPNRGQMRTAIHGRCRASAEPWQAPRPRASKPLDGVAGPSRADARQSR
jgi:hypothetical protein